jgi:hypothetical protein
MPIVSPAKGLGAGGAHASGSALSICCLRAACRPRSHHDFANTAES